MKTTELTQEEKLTPIMELKNGDYFIIHRVSENVPIFRVFDDVVKDGSPPDNVLLEGRFAARISVDAGLGYSDNIYKFSEHTRVQKVEIVEISFRKV